MTFGEVHLLYVADHTNDREDLRWFYFPGAPKVQLLPYSAAIRPVAARKVLIHDAHLQRHVVVCFVEKTAFAQRYAHGGKVITEYAIGAVHDHRLTRRRI